MLGECAARQRDCVIVAIAGSEGSVPRETGAAMIVADASVAGTIGGGHLELKAQALARELLARASVAAGEAPVLRRFPLGPALGQCCGGVVHLALRLCRSGVVPRDLEIRAPLPLFHLRLYGAGHVGQALVDVLSAVECEITWIDSREQMFPARVPDHARVEFSEAPQEEVAGAPAGAFHLVMTHSHALDLAITERILRRADAGFVGLIGSLTKRAVFERRLRERGVDETSLAQLVCPIGVAGITGKSPGVVAIAIAAQLLQAASPRLPEMAQRSSLTV